MFCSTTPLSTSKFNAFVDLEISTMQYCCKPQSWWFIGVKHVFNSCSANGARFFPPPNPLPTLLFFFLPPSCPPSDVESLDPSGDQLSAQEAGVLRLHGTQIRRRWL